MNATVLELSMDEDKHDGSPHKLMPIPSDCEWMDTEGGDLLWYEKHMVADKAKAAVVLDHTMQQSLSPQWYNEHAKRITASRAKEIICHRTTTDLVHLPLTLNLNCSPSYQSH